MNFIEWLRGAFGWQSTQEEVEELNDKVLALQTDIDMKKVEITALKSMIKGETVNSAKQLGTITYSDIQTLLKPHCDNIYLSDKVFSLTSLREAKRYSVATKLYVNKWDKEDFDCDEFSFALAGYWNLDLYQFAFGIAWSNRHAFNIFINEKKELFVVEPQTNKFIPIETAKKNSLYYPLRFVII